MKTRIGVIGADGKITPQVSNISERIGADIAKSDSVLICGGRGGVMEAACRGAKNAGGLVIGILPSYDKKEGNPYMDAAITTGLNHSRNSLVVSSSDAIIAINGRPGTLSEAAIALCMGKPLVAVAGSGGVAGILEEELKKMGIKEKIRTVSPEHAVKTALKLIK